MGLHLDLDLVEEAERREVLEIVLPALRRVIAQQVFLCFVFTGTEREIGVTHLLAKVTLCNGRQQQKRDGSNK